MTNELAPRQPDPQGAMVAIGASREAQEVQAAMLVAQRCPRDETESTRRILTACKRKRLAEQATYAFPRGGSLVTGPSIRLAEVLAQNWGNMVAGVREVSRTGGVSVVQAYAWDLETNFREERTFEVKHVRDTKQGSRALTDERDIYEMVANVGARRKRACILAVMPGDVVDEALEVCTKTLAGDGREPLVDRVRRMAHAFHEMGVTQEMLEKRLGHTLEACIEQELVTLRQIYTSLKDGMAKREQYFELSPAQAPKGSRAQRSDLSDTLTPQEPQGEPETDDGPEYHDEPEDAAGEASEPEGYGPGGPDWREVYEGSLPDAETLGDVNKLEAAAKKRCVDEGQVNVVTGLAEKRRQEIRSKRGGKGDLFDKQPSASEAGV